MFDGLSPCLPDRAWSVMLALVLLTQAAGLLALALKAALQKPLTSR